MLQSSITSDGRGWLAAMHNGTDSDMHVTLTVICINVSSSSAPTLSSRAMSKPGFKIFTPASAR
jgi:hypothetical protein